MAIPKLVAGAEGSPTNSTGAAVASSVNATIDLAEKGNVRNVGSLKDLLAFSAELVDGQKFDVTGFYAGADVGGGVFRWDSSKDKADHNGGTVIAPEALTAWDGTSGDIATLLDWTGAGNGCFSRQKVGLIDIVDFGSSAESSDNKLPIEKAVLSVGQVCAFEDGTYNHSGIEFPAPLARISVVGSRGVTLNNTSATGKHAIHFSSASINDRVYDITLEGFNLTGNSLSGDGIKFDATGWYDTGSLESAVTRVLNVNLTGHGSNGIQVGKDGSNGAGNKTIISGCTINNNGRTGVVVIAQTNVVSIENNVIAKNAVDGVELNQVASTNLVSKNAIFDNGRFGVYTFRCEEPLVTYNAFNRNLDGSIAFSGNSGKYTEAPIATGNLFGDNGGGSAEAREVQMTYTKGALVFGNYCYGTGQDVFFYVGDYVEGGKIFANHFKDLNSELKFKIKSGVVGSNIELIDDISNNDHNTLLLNRGVNYIGDGFITLKESDSQSDPRLKLKPVGEIESSSSDGQAHSNMKINSTGLYFGGGTNPHDVRIFRSEAGFAETDSAFASSSMVLRESTQPSQRAGSARLYLDSVDGLLKAITSDGTVKVISWS